MGEADDDELCPTRSLYAIYTPSSTQTGISTIKTIKYILRRKQLTLSNRFFFHFPNVRYRYIFFWTPVIDCSYQIDFKCKEWLIYTEYTDIYGRRRSLIVIGSITEVRRRRARFIIGWVTAW